MTLRHMIIFRTVYESDCNSTKLEQYYGVRLFDRIGRRLKITDSGMLFLQYAIHITDLFEDMETGLRDWDSKGILRVGASITIGSQFLPGYVKAYAEICPGIDVRVVVEQSDSLEHKILTNALDFAQDRGGNIHARSAVCPVLPGQRLEAGPDHLPGGVQKAALPPARKGKRNQGCL